MAHSVSLKRINNFLCLDDVDPELVIRVSNPNYNKPIEYTSSQGEKKVLENYSCAENSIIIHDGSFAWGDGPNVLHDINVRVCSFHWSFMQ